MIQITIKNLISCC